jgi:hypothetical protein
MIVVFKLHHRACDGNTALLFNFHPVTGCMTACLSAFHGSGHLNRSAEKQKLFR